MDLRESSLPFDDLIQIARFLATSLTFTTNLKTASLYFDLHQLVHLTKSVSDPDSIDLVEGLRTTSDGGLMSVRRMERKEITITAEAIRWIYQPGCRDDDFKPLETVTTDVDLTMWRAEVEVHVAAKLGVELERAMQKSISKRFHYDLIYVSYFSHYALSMESQA
jgi:hypothetical protein